MVVKVTEPDLHTCSNRDILHVGCLAEKMVNDVVLIRAININLKQVKEKSYDFCITWKVVGFLEFYHFPVHKRHQNA